jgi:hypothetical protein
MLKQIWNLLVRLTVVAGVLLGFIFLAECLRLFALFYNIHPAAGFAFAGILCIGTIVLFIYLWRGLRACPRVLAPPPMPELPAASHAEMRRYCNYLVEYLDRLAENPNLDAESVKAARDRVTDIEDVLGAHPLNEDLVRTIAKTEEETIGPLLRRLDERASQEVRRSVRDVMLAVTLSPYPSADIFIVLYRDFAMAFRVMRIYKSRPTPREEWRILRDILAVVATVNFLNIGRKLIESLFSQVPLIGRVIDDIGQGLGAGLLTSVAGHAAMDRCAAFRGWNNEEEVRSLGSRMANFLVDVKDLFTKDLMPELKGPIRSAVSPDEANQPGFWDAVTSGIASAIDMTAKTLDFLVIKPATAGVQTVAAGVQGVANVSSRIGRGVAGTSSSTVRRHHREYRPAQGGLGRALSTFSQRMKYTFFGHGQNK